MLLARKSDDPEVLLYRSGCAVSSLKQRAVGSALAAGGGMLVFSLLYVGGPGEPGWPRLLWQSAMFGFIGFVMGLLPQSDDYDWPGKPRPLLVDPPFVVHATTGARVIAGVLGLFCAGGMTLSLMGLLGGFEDGTLAFYAAFGALCLWLGLMCLKAFRFRIEVAPTALSIRLLIGWTEIPLAGIDRIEPRSRWASFSAIAEAPISALHWTDSDGRQRNMLLSLEPKYLVHGHSLLAILSTATPSEPCRAAG